MAGLLEANRFATKIRNTFPGATEPNRSIRRLLLEADVETIDSIIAYHRDDRMEALRSVSIEPATDEKDVLSEIDAQQAHAEALEDVHSTLTAQGYLADATPSSALEVAEAQVRAMALDSELNCNDLSAQIGDAWRGSQTKVNDILPAMEAAEAIASSDIPRFLVDTLVACETPIVETIKRLHSIGAQIVDRKTDADRSLRAFTEMVTDRADAAIAEIHSSTAIGTISAVMLAAANHRDDLMQWVSWLRANADARDDGLGPILGAYADADIPLVDLADAYDRVLYRSLVRKAVNAYPEIGEAHSRTLSDIRQRFRDLDTRIMEIRRQKLVADLASRPIPTGIQSSRKSECTDASLIENEIAKKKKHIPIRDLVTRANNAIMAMKPCMMMSPASVAQYLKPDVAFDVLIVDEASQMRPEEAVGALARARQAVIVGDPQQLPPTSFFDRQESDDTNLDDEVEKVVAESILDFARTAFRPERELLWHYRSRHGSLISFSNKHFYDGRLIVFPSPQEGSAEYGVKLVPVSGQYRASVNVLEAQAVAKAALEHMLAHPGKSLGVVALNQPHRDLILREMDRTFIRHSEAERYRAHWDQTLEPFFVKNLENVQGDERDIIMISTVYGPDENGNVYQRFGPINGAAGDRRLNVLFSRAKYGVTVFSSLRPDQIRDTNAPRGTKLLKAYLEFAASGRLDAGHVPFSECESDFEQFVKERLEARGFEVVAQVGVAGFRIDLGVRHPDWPYGFLLGIECDGAAYHSSLSARDRDRLRQQILESLGWTIYRVWSTDWFRDQAREMAKLCEFIDRCLAEAKSRSNAQSPPIDLPEIDDNEDFVKVPTEPLDEETSDGADRSYNATDPVLAHPPSASGLFTEADLTVFSERINPKAFYDRGYDSVLMDIVQHVVAVEGPIRADVLARRIAVAHRFDRTGGRIFDRVTAMARKVFSSSNEGEYHFMWPAGTSPSDWCLFRVPAPGTSARSIDEISLPELRALATRVRQAGVRAEDDPVILMARVAGLQRVRAPSREKLSLVWRETDPAV